MDAIVLALLKGNGLQLLARFEALSAGDNIASKSGRFYHTGPNSD